ncbi:MAG: type IV pilin [Methanocorpusculum sp.]|nr:type IV pilin [Methanocorpusculum sp.]
MSLKKDSAVSPAIAVILIIMLTIVIVAVFAVAVIGFGSGVNSGKVVGVTVDSYSSADDCGINAKIWGGKDIDSLVSIKAYLGDYPLYVQGTLADTEIYNLGVGGSYKFSLKTTESDCYYYKQNVKLNIVGTNMIDASVIGTRDVNIVGKFSDGTESVIYTGRVSAPSNSGSAGIFLQEGNIRVTGYALTGNWLGHGLLIESLNGNNLKNKISVESCSLKSGTTTYKKGDLFGGTNEYTRNGKTYYALPINVDNNNAWTDIYPFSMGNDNSGKKINELTGTVTLIINGVNYDIQVTIPPRNNIMPEDDSYLKELTVDENADKIKLTLNELPKNSRNRYVAYVRYPDGSIERISNKINDDLKTVIKGGLEIKTEKLPSSAVLEVYGLGDLLSGNNNGAWYLVGKKILS